MASPTRRGPGHAQRNVTIEDVARVAGVGRQTVSNVLNGSGRVGAAVRARVLDVVAELGYQPHHGARSLRSRRTMQLGYLMPPDQLQPGSLIMMRFLQSLVAEAALRQHRVLVVTGDNPYDEIQRLISSRTVDAFVLSDLQAGDRRVALLCDTGTPFACFGRTSEGLPQPWADIDNVQAEAEAVRHVLAQGYTRPCYIGYASGNYWDAEREAGFRDGLASWGIPGDGAGLLRVDHDGSARGTIRSFLSSAQPDAVLVGSDNIAIIVYGIAPELKLVIGRDLAVVGFDGSIVAGLLHPSLTSVVIPVEDIAQRVVTRALWQIGNGPDGEPGQVVPASLHLGESTASRPDAGHEQP